MDQIDLYVNCIDEKEVDSVLKFFKQKQKNGGMAFKKTKIKKILRGQENVGKVGSVSLSPFMAVLNRLLVKELNDLSEKAFLMFLAEEPSNIPSYVKLANFIILHPDKFKELQPQIIENLADEERKLFNFGLKFEDDKELKEYMIQMLKVDNNDRFFRDVPLMMKILKILDSDNKETIGEINDLYDLYDSIVNSAVGQANFVQEFAYLKDNKDLDEEMTNLLKMKTLLDLCDYNIDKLPMRNEDNNKFQEIESTIKLIKEENKKIIKSSKEITKIHNAEKRDSEKRIKSLMVETKEMENELILSHNTCRSLSAEVEKLKNKSLIEKEEYQFKIKEIERYFEDSFESEENPVCEFGIIFSEIEINLAQKLFTEVKLIHRKNWKEQIDSLDKVYLHRQGISSREISKIKSYCSENNIKNKVISIFNEKDLIEKISIYKKSGGI
jgi:hypothetical protein